MQVSLVAVSLALHSGGLASPAPTAEEQLVDSAGTGLAAHGVRDRAGRLLPVLVEGSDGQWFAMSAPYAAAFSQGGSGIPHGRAVAAVVGTIDVLLVSLIALRLFRVLWLAAAAGGLLLLTPAHFAFSRMATSDGIWLLPLFSIWLLGIVAFLDPATVHRRVAIVISAAALALFAYTQPSAAMQAVILGGLSAIVVWRTRSVNRSDIFLIAGVSAFALLPLLLWFARYPSTYAETFGRWLLHPAHIRYPSEWVLALLNVQMWTLVSKAYWDFFSPAHLLASTSAPALTGVFTLAGGLLILAGVGAIRRDHLSSVNGPAMAQLLLVLVIIAAPFAAATFREPRAVARALAIAPAGALVATRGLQAIWLSPARGARAAAIALLLGVAVQFSMWSLDAFGGS